MTNIYALYKGDEFIIDGTTKKIAELLGIKERTLMFYKSPSYKKRGAKIRKRNRYELVLLERSIKEKYRFKKKWQFVKIKF